MPCSCDQCAEHCRTLGLANEPQSKTAIHKAYRTAAKLWHPDRHESDPRRKPEAEERFKKVQIAYRELTEHQKRPAELPLETIFAKPAAPAPFSFGDAPGCFTAPHFPPDVR